MSCSPDLLSGLWHWKHVVCAFVPEGTESAAPAGEWQSAQFAMFRCVPWSNFTLNVSSVGNFASSAVFGPVWQIEQI